MDSLITQKIKFKYAEAKPFLYVRTETLERLNMPGMMAVPVEELKRKGGKDASNS